MFRNFWQRRIGLAAAIPASLVLATLVAAPLHAQQDRRARLNVEHYNIEAEIDPASAALNATVQVRMTPEDRGYNAVFELHNALSVSRIVDESGRQIPATRSQQDFQVRLNFPESLEKGKTTSVTFTYDGKLTGNEESPVYGIKFAAIKPEASYLLYPARWFPVNDYTADRYTADMKIVVPANYRVLAGGFDSPAEQAPNGRKVYKFKFTQASFPGSIAVVEGESQRITTQGVTTNIWFRERKGAAKAYGEETAKVLTYLTSVFGLAPSASLTLVETEQGAPNGYAAPGLLFLSPRAIGDEPNPRVLANQIARQWWTVMVSPSTRNHLWIQNGMARYAELMYLESQHGTASIEADVRDTYVEALTVDNPPLIQSARLEDYSPEYWAATAAKGAAVLHMLRWLIGDTKFLEITRTIPNQFAWKGISTEDFRKVTETIAGENLQYFFIEWIESTGAPEFKLEFTVYRTQKGFRLMGKVAQDLDTFRMPVELLIETEGNPETKRIEVAGTSSEFLVETFGKPRKITLDPNFKVLRFNNDVRVAVAIRKGMQFAEVGEFTEALKEYQKALDVNRRSSLAHYRVAEIFLLQSNYQSAANEFREALNGDFEPKWTEVWSHINLGKIFDVTGQRERALNEYNLAVRTRDNSQGAQEEAAKYIKTPYERPRPQN